MGPECLTCQQYQRASLDISYANTGLIFNNDVISASGSELKAGVAALKASAPGTQVLLSVGGGLADYNRWSAMNTQCLKDMVDDLGFDGVDIDFEKETSCTASQSSGRVTCTTDAELVGAAEALRAVMPAKKYLMSTATWSTGMYGEGIFKNSMPNGAWVTNRGGQLALARSNAGQSLDLINIMSYEAGWTGTTGWGWQECYRAHRAYWKTQAIAIGVMVTPRAGPADWDGYAITLPDLVTRAKYAQSQSGSAQYGIMLWSLQLATNCPNAQNITTTNIVVGCASQSTAAVKVVMAHLLQAAAHPGIDVGPTLV
eukprot:gene203-397_t